MSFPVALDGCLQGNLSHRRREGKLLANVEDFLHVWLSTVSDSVYHVLFPVMRFLKRRDGVPIWPWWRSSESVVSTLFLNLNTRLLNSISAFRLQIQSHRSWTSLKSSWVMIPSTRIQLLSYQRKLIRFLTVRSLAFRRSPQLRQIFLPVKGMAPLTGSPPWYTVTACRFWFGDWGSDSACQGDPQELGFHWISEDSRQQVFQEW